MKVLLLISATLLLFTSAALAQDEEEQWVTPGVEGDRPTKWLVFNYKQILPFQLQTKSNLEGVLTLEHEVKKLEELEFKLRFPIWLRPRLKMFWGIKYSYEEYNFTDPDNLTHPFFHNLENKHLNKLRNTLNFNYSMRRRRFLAGRGGIQFNGDYTKSEFPLFRYAKFTAMAVYGWKKNEFTSWGIGVYYNYSLGRQSIYPGIMFNKTFNEHWGLEAIFPAQAALRYRFSENALLLGGYDVDGASYHIVIDNPPFSEMHGLELRRSDGFAYLSYERKLVSFIWANATLGYRVTVNFDVFGNNQVIAKPVLENTAGNSAFFQLGIFAIPPQKLVDRHSQ